MSPQQSYQQGVLGQHTTPNGAAGHMVCDLHSCLSAAVAAAAQDLAPPPGIPGVGHAGGSSSLHGHYSQHSNGSSGSGLLLDPTLPPDTLAVTLAAKRAALMERESALQVRGEAWLVLPRRPTCLFT